MSDNEKGLILAVASSLFIGTSFILKKKGLKRAAASGTRAGQSQFHSKSISRSLQIVHLFIQFYQESVFSLFSFPNELNFRFRLYHFHILCMFEIEDGFSNNRNSIF